MYSYEYLIIIIISLYILTDELNNLNLSNLEDKKYVFCYESFHKNCLIYYFNLKNI